MQCECVCVCAGRRRRAADSDPGSRFNAIKNAVCSRLSLSLSICVCVCVRECLHMCVCVRVRVCGSVFFSRASVRPVCRIVVEFCFLFFALCGKIQAVGITCEISMVSTNRRTAAAEERARTEQRTAVMA